MKNFTAYENISITRMLQGFSKQESFDRAFGVLNDLGLDHLNQERMAQELSGGQQQRLAFARAIIPDFTVLFGDEPTGNLDSENATKAMELLTQKLGEYENSSAIIVSHDMHLAVTFGDVIVKIKKTAHERKATDDETTYYGLINEDCVFTPLGRRALWSNGKESFSNSDFEAYLRKR